MATALAPLPVRRTARALPIFLKETKYEFLKLLRTRSFSLSIIGFPVMFYVLFGVMNRHVYDGNVSVAKVMLGGYACFGAIGAALFGIGVGLANERSQGWLELKRASPMPPLAYLFGKCVTAMAFGLIIVTILTVIGIEFADVSITPMEIAKMFGMSAVGSIVFASMGLLLALLVPANAAPGVVNLIYLPMSFLSGLWIPVRFLPHAVQKVAPLLPTYHLSQLMLSIFGYRDQISLTTHWGGLAGFTLLMLGISWAVFNRQENA
ncbi:ABC transporter permease [Granulicella arctica]|uniref:Transport permease protein n=1 Tax=Granulicella arctica TaxID=940613 RepID=A0A7Y9PF15_9BACT|nr:ABC transporter permease [Granulicella arctica]NYF78480.1 ABC-2 type transport system permease protein [Granulicella arctica]